MEHYSEMLMEQYAKEKASREQVQRDLNRIHGSRKKYLEELAVLQERYDALQTEAELRRAHSLLQQHTLRMCMLTAVYLVDRICGILRPLQEKDIDNIGEPFPCRDIGQWLHEHHVTTTIKCRECDLAALNAVLQKELETAEDLWEGGTFLDIEKTSYGLKLVYRWPDVRNGGEIIQEIIQVNIHNPVLDDPESFIKEMEQKAGQEGIPDPEKELQERAMSGMAAIRDLCRAHHDNCKGCPFCNEAILGLPHDSHCLLRKNNLPPVSWNV